MNLPRRICCLLSLAIALPVAGEPDRDTLYAEALASWQAGDAPATLDTVDRLHAAGHHAAAVWLLEGNAHMLLGKRAEAALAYRRALAADPGLAEARQNLDHVLALLDPPPPPGERPLGRLLARTNPRWLILGAAVAGWACLTLLLAARVTLPRAMARAPLVPAAITSAVIAVACGSVVTARALLATDPGDLYQVMDRGPLLGAPARRAEPILETMDPGAIVHLVDEAGGWKYIEASLGGGSTIRGWSTSATVVPVLPGQTRKLP